MKFKITSICVACFILAMFIPSIVFSQQAAQPAPAKEQQKSGDSAKRVHPREAYAPDQRPEENYLARFKAIEVSEKLMDENLENIYILKVIVLNFKDQGWEKEYDSLYEEYKAAVSKFYKRQVIYSRVELEKNKKNINELFKKIFVVYEEQAQTMLDECADKILNFSLDEKNKYDPNRNRTLYQNMSRLWIAYGQIDDADNSSLDNVYKSAIYHLRISKAYAIQILEDLSPEGTTGEKYRVHKADNLNRVLTTESAKSTTPGPQASPASAK